VQLTELSSIDRASPYLRRSGPTKYVLPEDETESSLRNVVLKYKKERVLTKKRTMSNVPKYNICINASFSQALRSYLIIYKDNSRINRLQMTMD
jgi:hypothetical protein